MPNKNDEKLWNIVEQRINRIKDDSLPTKQEIDELHATLDKRQDGESVFDWLSRVLITMPQPKPKPTPELASADVLDFRRKKPIAVWTITRLAAADGNFTKKTITLRSEHPVELTITPRENDIHVEAITTGHKNKQVFRFKLLEISCEALYEVFQVKIELDAMANGEAVIPYDEHSQKLLLDPGTSLILSMYD